MVQHIKELTTMYNVTNNLTNNVQCNAHKVLSSFPDLIVDEYEGFYVNKLKMLGVTRFTELANKARASSNSPSRLFSWMLKNPGLVK